MSLMFLNMVGLNQQAKLQILAMFDLILYVLSKILQ